MKVSPISLNHIFLIQADHKKKLTGLSYFTISGLVDTTDTHWYGHER